MKRDAIILKKEKFVFGVFIVLNMISIVFMIGTLAAPVWISLDTNDQYDFEGSLYRIEEGLDSIVISGRPLENLEGKTYSEATDYLCDLRDQLYEADITCGDLYTHTRAGCLAFASIAFCSLLYFIFELIAIVSTIGNIGVLGMALRHVECLWVSLFTIYITTFLHIFSYSMHVALTKQTFDGDCDELMIELEPGKPCARDGSILALFTCILILIIGVAQSISILLFYKRRLSRNEEKLMTAAVISSEDNNRPKNLTVH